MSNDNIRAFGIASQRIACAKPPGIDAPAAILSDSALQLLEAFRTTHNPDDLNQAMEKIEDALKATPANDSAKPRRLNVLALIQQTQYECLRDVEALSGAIDTLREASMIATNDSMRFQLAKSLRVVLGYHYDECHDIEELKAAIRANQDAVKYCPEPRALSENYNNLSEIRRQLFEVEGDPEILDLAIQDAEQAATHAVPNDPFLSVYYHTLGIALRAKWTLRKVDTHILNRAIACSERCISLPCPNPQYEPLFRNSYAVSFRAKLNLFGNINDLDKAICQYQKIFTLPVLKPRDRSMYLNNLGIALLTKFRRLGNIEDLNRGINVLDDALVFAKRRVDVGDQSMCLSNLSILLATRFESTGATGDLNKAVDCSEEALAVALKSQAPRSPWLVARFINCGNAHKMRYLRSNEAADLESTIAQYTAGWEVCDVGTPQYYYLANNLGVVYRLRYENAVQPDSADLDKAFHWHQLAIGTGSVPSAKHLSNMAKCLLSRYKRDGEKNELIEALSRIREALGKCDNSEPVRSAYLDTLGEVYLYLYLESNDTSDLDQALASYKAGMEVESAPPTLRIEAGQRASSLLEGMGRLEEAFQLLEQCVTLLPETSTRASDFVDQQHRVSGLTGLGSDACALCLTCNNDPKKAAELLESGRVVILRRLMDLRVEVEDLPKELANEYERLRLLLDPPFQYNMAPQLQQPDYVNMAHRAASDFKSLCDQIRNIPGFEKFERAIDLSEMGAVTENQSIVLINVNHRRCDAFIFTDGKVVGMRLGVGLNEIIRQVARFQVIVSKLTTYEIGTNVHSEFSLVANSEDCIQIEGEFHEILEWLWNTITSPILEELNLHIKVLGGNRRHVVWCPTGPLSFLPLHAAGYHRCNPRRTVMDQAVSSYTSSIKALMSSKRRSTTEAETRVLIAKVTRRDLRTAEIETKVVKNAICAGGVPDSVVCVLDKMSKETLSAHLPDYNIQHFVCHAKADINPSESALLLTNGEKIVLSELARIRFRPGALAYLSACSTSVTQEGPWVDEGLTLTNAFQVAGFAWVVGTLWDAEAMSSIEIAERFYLSLKLDVSQTATALQHAVMEVRDLRLEEPSLWAGYVCIG